MKLLFYNMFVVGIDTTKIRWKQEEWFTRRYAINRWNFATQYSQANVYYLI